MPDLRERFIQLRKVLTTRHIERYDEVEIGLVALLSQYHVVYLGPPGTAKSMLAEDLTKSIRDARLFKYLISKFTVPEELFGALDVKLLKEGVYRRQTDAMMPEAEIAFVDEVFKGSSAINNSQLMIMNERQFMNGKDRMDVPLITMFGASNEMPEGEELAAHWDRFHFRKRVDYIKEPSNFIKMMKADDNFDPPEITLDDLREAHEVVKQIHVPDHIYETLHEIRSTLLLEGIVPSDRRMHQTIRPLQVMAWLHHRDVVTDDDLGILEHMLWNAPGEIKTVTRIILSNTNPLDQRAQELSDEADVIAGQVSAALMDCRQKQVDPKKTLISQGVQWFTKCMALMEEVKTLEAKAIEADKPMARIERSKNRVIEVARGIARNIIGERMETKLGG